MTQVCTVYEASSMYEPKHVRHNEESHMRTTDVDLIEMADPAIARSNGDILELNVHVVFSCNAQISAFTLWEGGRGDGPSRSLPR